MMKFIINKFFAFIAVGFLVISVFVMFFLLKNSFTSAQTTCAIISYAQDKAVLGANGESLTKPVLVNGIANSGQLDFNIADSNSKACIYKSGDKFLMEGLVWNTNLGWMSFNGTGYGVSVSSDGKAVGKAYGDNIGYIQMGCENGANLGENCTASTGATNYGVKLAMTNGEISSSISGDCGTMEKGDLYGYAWADTVGWMNFCGAHVDLDTLEEPVVETPPADTGTTTPPADTGTNPPYMETYPPELPAYQVAQVVGNVRANMIVDTKNLPVKSWISYPIGNPISSNRERFLRIAKKSSVELTPDSFDFGTQNIKTIDKDTLTLQDKTKIFYFKRNKDTTEPCKIIFDGADEIQYVNKFNKDSKIFITIVSQGCDIFIDRNLRSAYREKDSTEQYDVPKSRLGIIAFSDLSMPGERKGGNVYICSRVTDVESHLVMDGNLFSYGREENDCGGTSKVDSSDVSLIDKNNGYPNFEGVDIKSLLRNQLTIVGMFLGSNTYGGAVADKPALGDGTIVGTSSEDIAKARLFDVNFLRYANVEQHPTVESQLCWSKGTQLAKYLLNKEKKHDTLIAPYGKKKWAEICEYNFPIDDRPDPKALTTIMYMDPTADLPIFNGMVGKNNK